MDKLIPLVFVAILLIGGCTTRKPAAPSAAQEAPEPKTAEAKIYSWLGRQQNKSTGLLGNQEGETFCGTYPNALAALCFIHQGDTERAEKMFRFFQSKQQECFGGAPGGFYQFWDAETGEGHRDSDRWIGDNAWLLIALNHHKRITSSTEFDGLRESIARWLLSLQDADGGIWSGYNKNGLMESKSTEGNLDSYAALVDYPAQRTKVRQFLVEEMWLPEERRFKMGSTDPNPAMDTSAWGVSALGREFTGTLRFAEEAFLRTKTSKASAKQVTAFSDFRDHDRIWLEGSGEMIVAYQSAGEPENARRYLAELEKAMIPSQAFPGAAGIPCHTNDPAWDSGADRIFVPSQAWYLFGAWGFDPLATVD